MPEPAEFRGAAGPTSWRCAMSALLVGYARCSTDQQDLTAQRDSLVGLGVDADRIYVDHGLTGTNRERPRLREALAACRAGDTLVVTKLDCLARSLPDARAIADELTTRQISLSLGGSVYDPTDAVGRLLFNVLAMVAEFESDLIRLRTVVGMKVAKAKGRLRGKQPKLNRRQEAHLVSLVHSGEYSTLEVAELFGVGRSTVYRAPLNANGSRRRPTSRKRRRGTEATLWRRPSRIRHPSGTSAPSAFKLTDHVLGGSSCGTVSALRHQPGAEGRRLAEWQGM
jgi:DNA invertase Pin-like site-specific DNA recombinase